MFFNRYRIDYFKNRVGVPGCKYVQFLHARPRFGESSLEDQNIFDTSTIVNLLLLS
jgi:hypothetical protein